MQLNPLEAVTPMVGAGNYSMFPNNGYGWLEYFVGMLVGFYAAITPRSRDTDCFSRTFNMGIAVHGYAKKFDKAWEHTALAWADIILKVGFDGYGAYKMVTTCIGQLNYSIENPWEKEFRTKGAYKDPSKVIEPEIKEIKGGNQEDPSSWDNDAAFDFYTPVVGEKLNIMKIVALGFGILSDIVGLIQNYTSNYYYYQMGKNLTGMPTKVFVLVDYLLGTMLISPTPAWDRYRYGPAPKKQEKQDCGVCKDKDAACEKKRIACEKANDEKHGAVDAKKENKTKPVKKYKVFNEDF